LQERQLETELENVELLLTEDLSEQFHEPAQMARKKASRSKKPAVSKSTVEILEEETQKNGRKAQNVAWTS
jgi:hypothetical protein